MRDQGDAATAASPFFRFRLPHPGPKHDRSRSPWIDRGKGAAQRSARPAKGSSGCPSTPQARPARRSSRRALHRSFTSRTRRSTSGRWASSKRRCSVPATMAATQLVTGKPVPVSLSRGPSSTVFQIRARLVDIFEHVSHLPDDHRRRRLGRRPRDPPARA